MSHLEPPCDGENLRAEPGTFILRDSPASLPNVAEVDLEAVGVHVAEDRSPGRWGLAVEVVDPSRPALEETATDLMMSRVSC
jgi:hypothetical protein